MVHDDIIIDGKHDRVRIAVAYALLFLASCVIGVTPVIITPKRQINNFLILYRRVYTGSTIRRRCLSLICLKNSIMPKSDTWIQLNLRSSGTYFLADYSVVARITQYLL